MGGSRAVLTVLDALDCMRFHVNLCNSRRSKRSDKKTADYPLLPTAPRCNLISNNATVWVAALQEENPGGCVTALTSGAQDWTRPARRHVIAKWSYHAEVDYIDEHINDRLAFSENEHK